VSKTYENEILCEIRELEREGGTLHEAGDFVVLNIEVWGFNHFF